MRVLLSGGGTGGHINPALAIAGKIKKEQPDCKIEYVGTKKGLEVVLVPKEDIKIHYVHVKGFRRKLSFENIGAAVEAVTSVIEAKKIIKQFCPDIVIGTGGYVCWPVLKAAADMGIPTMIHESNAVPGVATKMLSRYVDKILLNFEETRKYLTVPEEKTEIVGNPLKSQITGYSAPAAKCLIGVKDDKPLLLSYGGSLGAARINETILDMIREYSLKEQIYHIHATGSRYFDEIRDKCLQNGFKQVSENEIISGNVSIRKYIYDMPKVLCAADIVICRGGAMTISEISACGKAAIIIPSPNVTNNHQYKNAEVLQKAGAAVLIEEKNLDAQVIVNTISDLINNKEKTSSMQKNIRKFAVSDSLDRIYSSICRLLSKNTES